MNCKSIFYILGWILRVEGLFLFLPMIVALIYGEDTWTVYLICAALTFAAGLALSWKEAGISGCLPERAMWPWRWAGS